MEKIIQTVVYVLDKKGRVLLGHKKVRLGAGLWNGYGGNLEPNETIEQCAMRELLAESGIKAIATEKCGIVITRVGRKKPIELHFFVVREYRGRPRSSDEMDPRWFSINSLPYGQMWPSDRFILPLFFEGKKCRAEFYLQKGGSIILFKVQEVESLI